MDFVTGIIAFFGEVAEWSNVPDSKSGVPKGTGGSNPSLSANGLVVQLVRIQACHAWGREFESRPDRQLLRKALRAML